MKNKKALIIGAAVAVMLIAVVVIALIIGNKNKLSATTMRLLQIEGTVTLQSGGKQKKIIDNLKLNSGDVLTTGVKSLAGIALDDSKAVRLEESSEAEFNQSGKKLDLNLKKGSLFFDVSKKLEADESFEIRTATMIAGIRGTSGYVIVKTNGEPNGILITDGSVEVKGINPETGKEITTTVNAGQIVYVYLYDDVDPDKSVSFQLLDVSEDELPDEVVRYLVEHEDVLDRVCEATGWSKDKIKNKADGLPSPTPKPTATPTPEEEEEEEEPTDTPTPEPTATNTPTPTNKPAPPKASPTPTNTPSPTPTKAPAAPQPTPTATPAPEEPTPTESAPTPTKKPTNTPTPTPTPTSTPTPTPTPTPTSTPTPTPVVKVSSIIIDSSISVAAGKKQSIGCSVFPDNASNKTVNWSSSNTSIATVDSSGIVTGVAAGSATVTATAADGSGVSASCSVTVTKAATSLTINHTELTVPVGGVAETGASVEPSDIELTWTSADTSIAVVTDGMITGIKAGTTTITVSGGGLSASCKVIVEEDTAPVLTVLTPEPRGSGVVRIWFSLEGLKSDEIYYVNISNYSDGLTEAGDSNIDSGNGTGHIAVVGTPGMSYATQLHITGTDGLNKVYDEVIYVTIPEETVPSG